MCALVLGGYVNGYSIIKELFEQGIEDIALFDTGQSIARFSNKIKYHSTINREPKTLLTEVKKLNSLYDFIVIFPTNDQQLRNLHIIYDEIYKFCYLPFNQKNLLKISDKYFQYKICEKIGISYPKTFKIKSVNDLDFVKQIKFPVIIKPTISNLNVKLFRVLFLEKKNNFNLSKNKIIKYLNEGIEFVLSEYIPGEDNNIYAYTCFRSQKYEILNEWVGQKLSQHPGQFGTFSSATNTFNLEVYKQGRLLVETLNAFGIIQTEFKYDYRDKKFKLMEVSLRSDMWHRTGCISGVKINETQYNYAIGKKIYKYKQDLSKKYHFVLMLHELSNLIDRKNYWKVFKYNVWGGDKCFWAIFELKDIMPFFYSIFEFLKTIVKIIIKKIILK